MSFSLCRTFPIFRAADFFAGVTYSRSIHINKMHKILFEQTSTGCRTLSLTASFVHLKLKHKNFVSHDKFKYSCYFLQKRIRDSLCSLAHLSLRDPHTASFLPCLKIWKQKSTKMYVVILFFSSRNDFPLLPSPVFQKKCLRFEKPLSLLVSHFFRVQILKREINDNVRSQTSNPKRRHRDILRFLVDPHDGTVSPQPVYVS